MDRCSFGRTGITIVPSHFLLIIMEESDRNKILIFQEIRVLNLDLIR